MILGGECGVFSDNMMEAFKALKNDFFRIARKLIEKKETA